MTPLIAMGRLYLLCTPTLLQPCQIAATCGHAPLRRVCDAAQKAANGAGRPDPAAAAPVWPFARALRSAVRRGIAGGGQEGMRMRVVDAAEAVAGIRSGQQVFLHGGAATPSVLLDALVARAAELTDVKILHLHCEGPGPHLEPSMAGHFRHRAFFIGSNARLAVEEGRAEYIPVFLSDI